jgi:hemoglobin/transferrin/lactoferrin receptor protein
MKFYCLFFIITVVDFLQGQSLDTGGGMNDTVYITFRNGENRHKSAYSVFRIKNPLQGPALFRTVPESLMQIPGLQVQKTNHGGGSPYLRGLTGNQVLMLIDGIRLNNGLFRYGPNQYLNTTDGMALSALEVAYGTGCIQYGSDALGGVIALNYHLADYTASKKDKMTKVGCSSRISYPTSETTQRVALDIANHQYAASFGFTYRNFGHVVGGGNIGQQSPSGYSELAFNFGLKRRDRLGEWIICGQKQKQDDIPLYHKVKLENFRTNQIDLQERQLYYIRRIVNLGAMTSMKITSGLQFTNEQRSSIKNNTYYLMEEVDKLRTKFLTAEINKNILKKLRLNAGCDIYTDRVFSGRSKTDLSSSAISQSRGLYPNNAVMWQNSAYGMVNGELSNLTFTLGSRYQHTTVRFWEPSLGSILDENSALVHSVGVSANLLPKYLSGLRIYSNYSVGFRAPNIDDFGTLGVVDFRYEIPQYGLRPEYSNQIEYGLKYQKNDWVEVQICSYTNFISGLISRVRFNNDSISGYPVYRKENVDNCRIQGIEASANINIKNSLKLIAGIAHTEGVNIATLEPMRRITPLNGFIAVFMKAKKQRYLRYFVKYTASAPQRKLSVGDIADNRIGSGGTPGFVQIDMGCEFKWKNTYFNLNITNITNEKIKIHGSGIFMPGRNITLSVIY